ncbi:hypothetical protein pb186bvf_021123 [Paramecium bursaria]
MSIINFFFLELVFNYHFSQYENPILCNFNSYGFSNYLFFNDFVPLINPLLSQGIYIHEMAPRRSSEADFAVISLKLIRLELQPYRSGREKFEKQKLIHKSPHLSNNKQDENFSQQIQIIMSIDVNFIGYIIQFVHSKYYLEKNTLNKTHFKKNSLRSHYEAEIRIIKICNNKQRQTINLVTKLKLIDLDEFQFHTIWIGSSL